MRMRFAVEVQRQLLNGNWEEQEAELEHGLDVALRTNGASPHNIKVTVVNPYMIGVSLVDDLRDIETVKDIINETLLMYFDDDVTLDSDVQVNIAC